MPERGLTLGTAGHIDHGKTTLIGALTGKDTDRLTEEKERGISIELGYAELALPSGRHLSVVDAPGHERFVKNMVAGATGIDVFLLTVAADDGVMPQTREHFRIVELLGIPRGVVALTKADAVDEEMVELAAADVEDLLAGTPYEDAPVIPVSGVTGQGLDRLLEVLDEVTADVPERGGYPATRLPIDRVFSLKGIGTVVTGTLWSGSLSPEETVAILPKRGQGSAGGEVRVRSIQVHDRQVEEAEQGQRVALNLSGVDRTGLERGQWVIKDPVVAPTYLADVSLSLLAGAAEPLTRVSRVRVDHGTQEVLAKVVLADREELLPGESAYAQLRFEDQVVVYPGDHFILRSLTPVTTIGGGSVFDPRPRKHGTDPRWRERLRVLEEGPGEEIAVLLLEEAFPEGIPRRRLEESPYLWRFDGEAAVAAVVDGGRALSAAGGAAGGAGGGAGRATLFDAASLQELEDRVREILEEKAERDPLDPYVSVGELRRGISGGAEWPALDAALERLRESGEVARTEHGLRWGEAPGGLEGDAARQADRLLERFVQAGIEVPSVEQAAREAGQSEAEGKRLVQALERQGRMVKVGEGLYYPADSLAEMMDRIEAEIRERGEISLAEVRDVFSTSRKYAQAILEHMDSEGRTLRIGDVRRLRRKKR